MVKNNKVSGIGDGIVDPSKSNLDILYNIIVTRPTNSSYNPVLLS